MKNVLFSLFLLGLAGLVPQAQQRPQTPSLKVAYQHGRWGYADAKGKMVIEPRFDAALPFDTGLARVGVVDEELPEIDGRPNLLWGYVDESGHVVVELRYNALRSFSEGLAAAAVLDPDMAQRSVFVRRGSGNFKWGFLDVKGRVVIPIQYFAAGDFSEGLAAVDVGGQRDGNCPGSRKFGYLDKTGGLVIKPQFASAGSFQNGRARVSIGEVEYFGRCLCCAPRFFGKHGFVDRTGDLVLEERPRSEKSFPDDRELRK